MGMYFLMSPRFATTCHIDDEAEQKFAAEAPSQSGRPEFFGIKINAERVVFVIGKSGSMDVPLGGSAKQSVPGFRPAGQQTRLLLAQQELVLVIVTLPTGTHFNIIAFDADIARWHLMGSTSGGGLVVVLYLSHLLKRYSCAWPAFVCPGRMVVLVTIPQKSLKFSVG